MTLPIWWYFVVSVIVAGAVWLAYTEGKARGKRAAASEWSKAVADAAWDGERMGRATGWTQARYAASVVLDRFPTSLGARAMFRALGGNPGPRPRRRTTATRIETDAASRVALDVLRDHEEGEE